MKRLTVMLCILFVALLSATYFIGERTQTEVRKRFAVQNKSPLSLQLLSYKKFLFTAKMQTRLTFPLENAQNLVLLIDSNITHYPYKVSVNNKISIVNQDIAQKVENFFQSKTWLKSNEEINLLGEVTGEVTLAKGSFQREFERLNLSALTVTYQLKLSDYSGVFQIDWAGFEGDLSGVVFALKDIDVKGNFSSLRHAPLIDYAYQADIAQLTWQQNEPISINTLWLLGENQLSDNKTLLSSRHHLTMAEYKNAQQQFSNTDVDLSVSNLNVEALQMIQAADGNTLLAEQALSYLIKQGLQIDLQTLSSHTPWGKVDARLNVEIQAGANLPEIVNNPFMLMDYSNGVLKMSLPQALTQQADVGALIQLGVSRDLLIPNAGQLNLYSSLDRGQLVINDRIIPM